MTNGARDIIEQIPAQSPRPQPLCLFLLVANTDIALCCVMTRMTQLCVAAAGTNKVWVQQGDLGFAVGFSLELYK